MIDEPREECWGCCSASTHVEIFHGQPIDLCDDCDQKAILHPEFLSNLLLERRQIRIERLTKNIDQLIASAEKLTDISRVAAKRIDVFAKTLEVAIRIAKRNTGAI